MSSVFIWSALSSEAQRSYGLNVSGCDNWAGAQIILYPWTGGAANELWTLDSDNHLITNMNPNN
jgi:hypothetical protein